MNADEVIETWLRVREDGFKVWSMEDRLPEMLDVAVEEIVRLRSALASIAKIQQEWWDGDVPMNVALSEIRQAAR